MKIRRVFRDLSFALAVTFAAHAQTITGTVTGSLIDPSGAAVTNAVVTLRSETTAESRSMKTNESGDFVFNAIFPGRYMVRAEREGFKTVERSGLILTATQRLSIGNLQMPVGAISERINVEGIGAAVQTAASGNSAEL